jgi:DNA-binding Lrp family transcriptional regulator
VKTVTQNPHQHKTGKQNNAPAGIDETDRKILQLIQDDFPLVSEPWLEISNRLNLKEAEVIKRLKRLTETGVVLRIGPIFDSAKMGLKAATLVAMKVPKNQVDAVASIINQYENVSHNYEREDEYNVWFTLAASTSKELAKKLSEIKQKTGIKEHAVLELPTVNRFKIKVNFQLT